MTTSELLTYANGRIEELGLADSETNCHGVIADDDDGECGPDEVRLSDGVGLNVRCRTTEQIDAELEAMAEWYAESE